MKYFTKANHQKKSNKARIKIDGHVARRREAIGSLWLWSAPITKKLTTIPMLHISDRMRLSDSCGNTTSTTPLMPWFWAITPAQTPPSTPTTQVVSLSSSRVFQHWCLETRYQQEWLVSGIDRSAQSWLLCARDDWEYQCARMAHYCMIPTNTHSVPPNLAEGAPTSLAWCANKKEKSRSQKKFSRRAIRPWFLTKRLKARRSSQPPPKGESKCTI